MNTSISTWQINLKQLNDLLYHNSMPKLKIVTDDNRNVTGLDQFKKTSYMLLEQCPQNQVILLRDRIIPPSLALYVNTNIHSIRYNIIDQIIKQVPYSI